MELRFHQPVAARFTNPSQRIRVLSEHWFAANAYCPNCGHGRVSKHVNNSPVADFFCHICGEDYELKGHGRALRATIADGAYGTMIGRLKSHRNPNLFLLGYDRGTLVVRTLMVVPKQFFVPDMIEPRIPLAPTARRAGWIGCKIRLDGIPEAGKIFVVRDGVPETPARVTAQWRSMLFLQDPANEPSKRWLLSVMSCVDRIGKPIFSLDDVYRFETELTRRFPGNRHVRPKIRQQLQVLRDNGYLIFLGRGVYRIAGPREGTPVRPVAGRARK